MRKNILIALAVGAALAAPAARADAGDTTVGGVIFADLTHASVTSNGSDVDTNGNNNVFAGNGLDVKRAYLIVNHQFDDIWSANLTTDFNFASYKDSCTVTGGTAGETCSVTTTTPETQLFVKKAYVQGKFDDMLVLHVGSYDTPWIPYAESVYGYRFVENTLIDRSQAGIGSFGNSADWGVNLNGANAMFNYSASLLNGGGYKNPSRTKAMDFEGRVGFTPIQGLIVGVGYYNGSLGQDTNANQLNAEGHPKLGLTQNQATREDALVAWKADGLTVGLEYFTAKNFGSKLIFSKSTDSEDGYSLYGSYDFAGTDYGVYARYDSVKPKKDSAPDLKDTYYNGGFAWRSNKNLTWAFGFKSDDLKDDTAGTSLKFQEVGVWLQAKY